MTRDTLPVRDPTAFPDPSERRDATVHGILLAAGSSSRFDGGNKLLATLSGTAIVRTAAETLAGSAVDDVTVVTGYQADRVAEVVDDLDVSIRENERYTDGQSTSIRVGVRTAEKRGADAVLIALGDMPWVNRTTCDLLVEAHDRYVADILAAAYRGRRGNPVLFDARHFDALADLDGDSGGRQLLLESEDAVAIETGNPGVLQDVDRLSDLEE